MAYDYSYKHTGPDDYFDALRGNIERDYNKGYRRTGENYEHIQKRYDYDISDLRENVVTGKERNLEDFITRKEGFNDVLAQIASRTFQRYVMKGSTIPTQVGLQNLAMKASSVEKAKKDAMNKRMFDRAEFDYDRILKRGERDYEYNSDWNIVLRDRGYEDLADNRDDSILGLNFNESNWRDGNIEREVDETSRLGGRVRFGISSGGYRASHSSRIGSGWRARSGRSAPRRRR